MLGKVGKGETMLKTTTRDATAKSKIIRWFAAFAGSLLIVGFPPQSSGETFNGGGPELDAWIAKYNANNIGCHLFELQPPSNWRVRNCNYLFIKDGFQSAGEAGAWSLGILSAAVRDRGLEHAFVFSSSPPEDGSALTIYEASGFQTFSDPRNFKNGGGSDCGEADPGGLDKGNPTHVATGNKAQAEIDYVCEGLSKLRLVRQYNTRLDQILGPFGARWNASYFQSVLLDPSNGYGVTLLRPNGAFFKFSFNGTNWTTYLPNFLEKLTSTQDGTGAFTSWTYTTLEDEAELYDATGKLVSITNRHGLVTTLQYDAQGRLSTVADPVGKTMSFSYDGFGRVSTVTLPDGNSVGYTYDSFSNLETVTYPDGKLRRYHHEYGAYPYLLTGITDEKNVRFATYTYNLIGQVATTEHAGGAERRTFVFNTDNSTDVTDPLGATAHYTMGAFSGLARLATVSTNCADCGQFPSSTYDSLGYLTSQTDWNSVVTNYTYDSARGLETQRVEAFGTPQQRTITTEWNPNFRLVNRIAQPFRITTNVYNGQGATCGLKSDGVTPVPGVICSTSIQATTDTNGSQGFGATSTGSPRTSSYTYNVNGSVLTIDGPRTDVSDITTYTYYANNDADLNKRGNVATIRNALNQTTNITSYNAHGQPLITVDPNGVTTTLTYDLRRRLTSTVTAGETTTYTYDDAGQLTRVTALDNSFIENVYDDAHRLTEVHDNLGNKVVYTLDLAGNRTKEETFDPTATLARTLSRVYSNLGRLSQTIGGQTQTSNYGYDSNGNLTSVADPLTHNTTYLVDALNRRTRVTDHLSNQTNFAYNGLDQATQVTDPRNLITIYTWNGLGDKTQEVSPDRGTTNNTYDSGGNLKTSTDARSKVSTYTYDALNRVTQLSVPDQTIAFTYDQGTNGIGRLTTMVDLTGNTQWSYDARGRVIRKAQQTTGPRVHVTESSYDAQGRLASMTYPSGRVVSYQYDTAGRVSQVLVDGIAELTGLGYFPFGSPKNWTWGSNVAHARTFDLDGRLATHTLGTATRTIGYDPASRIIQLDEGTPATTRTYGYDDVDRLTSFVYGATNQAYQYDAIGNRSVLTLGANNYAYTYPPTSNRLSSTAGPTARTFAYNAVGAVSGDGARTFTYNDLERVSQVTYTGGSNTYTLNGLGQRLTKAGTGVTTGPHRYAYDEAGHLIGEYDTNGDVLRETVFLSDMPALVLTKSTQEVVVDNTTAGQTTVVGNWATATADPGYQGTNYRTHAAGTGTNTFTWTPPVPANQSYLVYARWSANTNRATNAPYTVFHASGSTAIQVNQKVRGGEWNLLGTFTMAPGQNHRVRLTDQANGLVVADAIKIVPSNVTNTVFYIHADHLNTPLRVVSAANQQRWQWDPAPFGETPANENPSGLGTFTLNHRLPGQFFDKETNQHYNYFRDYSSELGRYLEFDPIGLIAGPNGYAYVKGNPLRYTDSMGLEPVGENPGGTPGLGDRIPRAPLPPPFPPPEPLPPWVFTCVRVLSGIGMMMYPSQLACSETPYNCQCRKNPNLCQPPQVGPRAEL
jgi:RHS repeat-associated protein